MSFFADFGDTFEIWDFHKGREAYKHDFWIALEGFFFEIFVINIAIFGDTITDKVVDMGRQSNWGAMCEVAASWE